VRFWYNPNFIAIFFLLFFSIFALKSLTKPGFYTSHDGETHTARIAQYYQALKDGQFPPRWAKTLSSGLGSPIFVYIYPLPYLAGALIHMLGANFVNSFKILMALSFIASGLFAYLWLLEVFKSPKSAFLGALTYTWVPYRFALIYVRASISESFAYTFLPFLLLSLTKLAKKTNLKWTALSALSLALLMLSQNLVAYMAIPLICAYVLILAIWQKSAKYLIYVFISAIWAFGISAVTYLPALFERNYIHFDQLFKDVYNAHFVTLTQLVHSPWGYGFDLPGTVNDQISFQIGLAHILIIFISLFVLFIAIAARFSMVKFLQDNFFEKPKSQEKILAIFFLLVIALSILLMLETRQTHLFWKNFKLLQIIDIPWRLLGIIALSTSFLASFAAKNIRSGLVFLFLVSAILIANRHHLNINEAKFYDDEFFLNYRGSATQFNEFTPKSRSSVGVTDQFPQRIEVVRGDAKISDINQKSNALTFKTESTQVSRLLVNVATFPGWQVFADNKKFESVDDPILFRELYRPDRDNTGLFYFIVPTGNHTFNLKFTETKLRYFADLLSLASFTAVILALAKLKKS